MQLAELIGLVLIGWAIWGLANHYWGGKNQGKTGENGQKNDNFQAYSASELKTIERLKDLKDWRGSPSTPPPISPPPKPIAPKEEIRTITRDDAFAAVNTLVLYFSGTGNDEGRKYASECGRALFPLDPIDLEIEQEIDEEIEAIERKLDEVKQ